MVAVVAAVIGRVERDHLGLRHLRAKCTNCAQFLLPGAPATGSSSSLGYALPSQRRRRICAASACARSHVPRLSVGVGSSEGVSRYPFKVVIPTRVGPAHCFQKMGSDAGSDREPYYGSTNVDAEETQAGDSPESQLPELVSGALPVPPVDRLHGGLHRGLSARQVSMIAIAGTIGTGLFLGTGKSLAQGGPASMLIWCVIRN